MIHYLQGGIFPAITKDCHMRKIPYYKIGFEQRCLHEDGDQSDYL